MSQTELTRKQKIQAAIDWCDQQAAEGNELILEWDGGGDSGWVQFKVDGEYVNNEHTEFITDLMYDELDYGSWAGEFTATGSASYDPDTQSFEGVDIYSEDETVAFNYKYIFRVPKSLWFDSLSYSLQYETGWGDEKEFTFNIRNGFLTEKHEQTIHKLGVDFDAVVDDIVAAWNDDENNGEFNGISDNGTILRQSFQEEGDFLVHTLDTISIRTRREEDKDVSIRLFEMLQFETDDQE